MRRWPGILLVVSGILYASAAQAQSNTCVGTGSFFVRFWEEAYNVNHEIGRLFLKFIPIVGQEQRATDAIENASVRFHNYVFKENRQSWTTIGPREIPVLSSLTTQGGTLQRVGPVAGVRTFSTAPLFWDRAEITIEKQSGGLKTEVVICTFDVESGAKNIVTNYLFPNGRGSQTKKFVVPNIHGKYITVKLAGRETNFDKFKYRIKTKGIVNMNKQRQRAIANGASPAGSAAVLKVKK